METGSEMEMTSEKEITRLSHLHLQDQKQLQNYVNWLSGIIESSQDLIVALDMDYRLVACNSAYVKEFSALYQNEIRVGVSLQELLAHDEAALKEAEALWRRALGGEEFRISWNPVNRLGQQKYFEITYKCIRNEFDEIIGATHYARDVTERVSSRQEVKHIQEFVLLANSMPEIVWTSSPEGKNDFINEKAADYSGLEVKELIEEGWEKLIHPDDLEICSGKLREFRKTGIPFEMEYRLLRHDGRYRWFMSRAVPLLSENGEVVKYLGSAADIHEQKLMVEKMEQKAKELQQITEAIPQLVWTTEPDGRHTYYNRRWYEYTGINVNQSLKGQWKLTLHPDDVERTRKVWRKCLASGDPYHIEYRFRRHDGEYRWFIGRAVPLRDKEGKIIRWFGTCTDIHDQKIQRDELNNKNEKLFQINRYLDEFVHAVAHDLRSPVAGLKLSFELLTQVEEAKKQKIMKGCQTYLDRLDNTLHGLVQLIEIQEDISRQKFEKIDIHQVLDQVTGDLHEKLQNARSSITFGTFDWQRISFPKPYLYNILRNIIRYALRFRDPDQELNFKLSASFRNGYHVIQVQENGPGIDLEKEMKNLFKPFSHINKGSDRQGMGLAIVKHMVEKNGGKIVVHSSMGSGTLFEIYLKEYQQSEE